MINAFVFYTKYKKKAMTISEVAAFLFLDFIEFQFESSINYPININNLL